jgi:hypothetical protein
MNFPLGLRASPLPNGVAGTVAGLLGESVPCVPTLN